MIADKDFYKVDREWMLTLAPLEKRLTSSFFNFPLPKSEYYIKTNDFLVRHFHNQFTFVSGEKIPALIVKPDTTESFCDLISNRIQLGTRMLADERFDQQKRLDGVFAVMIHEKWHKRYTIRDLARIINVDLNKYYGNQSVQGWMKTNMADPIFVSIVNILEDYRIEKLGLEEFPGYVFFFDQLRDYVLVLQSNKKPNLENLGGVIIEHLMFKILLPENLAHFEDCMDKAPIPNHLANKFKLCRRVNAKIDGFIASNLPLVYSDKLEDILWAAKQIFNLLPTSVKKEMRDDMAKSGKGFSSTHEKTPFGQSPGDDKVGGPGEDKDYDSELPGISEAISDALEDVKDAIDGNANAPSKGARMERINITSEHSMEYMDVKIIKANPKMEDQHMTLKAKKMGKELMRSLGILASRLNRNNTTFELTEGDIDEDEIYSIGFSKNVFQDEEEIPGFEYDITLLIDESGSMNRDNRIQNAKLTALMLYFAIEKSSHVNLSIYGHSCGRSRQGVELYEYFNPRRNSKNWKTIFGVEANGGNADGYAIAKVGEIMLNDSKAKKKLLLVISDGHPAAAGYQGVDAEKHVWDIVTILESKGIETIQVAIANIDRSDRMFKHFVPFDPKGDFVVVLRDLLRKRINRVTQNL